MTTGRDPSHKLLDYFIKHTDGRFDKIERMLEQLVHDVNKLKAFKWKIIGMATFAFIVIQFVFNSFPNR